MSSGAAAANGGGGGAAADPSTSWWTRFSPRAATAEEGGGGGGWWGFSPRYAQVRQSLASFARSLAADHGCPCAVAAPECPPGGCGAQPLRLDWRRIIDGGGSPSLAVGELLRDCAPPLCANIVISQKCSSLRGSVEPERSPFRDRWAFCAGDTGSCSHSSATTFQVAAPHSAPNACVLALLLPPREYRPPNCLSNHPAARLLERDVRSPSPCTTTAATLRLVNPFCAHRCEGAGYLVVAHLSAGAGEDGELAHRPTELCVQHHEV